MKFKIVGKTFEEPVVEADNADEAVIQFATNMDTNMNLYFKAVPANVMMATNTLTGIESEAQETNPEDAKVSSETALSVLAANMPKDFSGFNSETEMGEPQHLMDLPNGRTLRIVYQDTGDDERYYSWEVLYDTAEMEKDYNPRDLVFAGEDTDDFEYDTVFYELDWAIRVAAETPRRDIKPKFSVGDEVRFKEEGTFCYVVKVLEDGGVRLYDTCYDYVHIIPGNKLDLIALEGHSEMAEKVFSQDVDWIDDNCPNHYSDKDGSWCYRWCDIDEAPTIIPASS